LAAAAGLDRFAFLIGTYCIAGHHAGLSKWRGGRALSERLMKISQRSTHCHCAVCGGAIELGGKTIMVEPEARAALALHRFGLGPNSSAIADIASDPLGAPLAELNAGETRMAGNDLLASGEASRETFAFQQERKAAREARKDMANPQTSDPAQPATNMAPSLPQQIYLSEAEARVERSLDFPAR
jgi:hypothetical protein